MSETPWVGGGGGSTEGVRQWLALRYEGPEEDPRDTSCPVGSKVPKLTVPTRDGNLVELVDKRGEENQSACKEGRSLPKPWGNEESPPQQEPQDEVFGEMGRFIQGQEAERRDSEPGGRGDGEYDESPEEGREPCSHLDSSSSLKSSNTSFSLLALSRSSLKESWLKILARRERVFT